MLLHNLRNFNIQESPSKTGKELVLNDKYKRIIEFHEKATKIMNSNFCYNITSLHKHVYYDISENCHNIFKKCCIKLRLENDNMLNELKHVTITDDIAEAYVQAKKCLTIFDRHLREFNFEVPEFHELCSCDRLGLGNPYRCFEKIINEHQAEYDIEKYELLKEIDTEITTLLYGIEEGKASEYSHTIKIKNDKYRATSDTCNNRCAFWKNCQGKVNTCVILFGQTLNFEKYE